MGVDVACMTSSTAEMPTFANHSSTTLMMSPDDIKLGDELTPRAKPSTKGVPVGGE
jgi:hypothetical protein